jgi:hypothetical protein
MNMVMVSVPVTDQESCFYSDVDQESRFYGDVTEL